MTKPGRIPCEVPFCRRTADAAKYPEGTRIICGKHWRTAPVTWRARWGRLRKRYRRKFGAEEPWKFKAGSPERIEAVRLKRLIHELWLRCRKAAIEASGGI